ncbi:MAG: DUF4440 domain-containing protein [Phycisphaeraceae bacterium]|nr:DUF4440 domain-containing protein [Phycisphaeraceae bacterium]
MRYLFEQPWPLIVVLSCLAAALLISGLRRRKRSPIVVAGVLLAAAVGVFITATLVTTDREVVERLTQRVLDATVPLDAATLQQLIRPDAAVRLPNGITLTLLQPLPLELAEAVHRFEVTQQTMRSLDVEVTRPGVAIAHLTVRTNTERSGAPAMNTSWLLTWRQVDQDHWQIQDVQWLTLNNQEPPPEGIWR